MMVNGKDNFVLHDFTLQTPIATAKQQWATATGSLPKIHK
jgi:hypothetical protein